ncbi:proline dehydrogenase family protein [soil metagenome]
MTEFKLNFQDTETAFADKSNGELKEKFKIFQMMNSPLLNGIGTRAAQFALAIGLPVKGLIKDTIYKQFCGGETIEECQPTIEKLADSHIGTILDYSVEGKDEVSEFEHTKNEIHRTITRAKSDDNIPFAVFKVSGIASVELLEKYGCNKELFKHQTEEWELVGRRVTELCEYAHSIGQPIFIDAEESWIQDAIDFLANEMIERFNTEKPIVFNTIQLYRHDRMEFLKESHREAKEKGYILAVKLVRGAYMEKERNRAEEMKYPSPIHKNKAETDKAFDDAVEYCLDNIEEIAFVAGTHNEKSIQILVQKMEEKEISHDHRHVFFSQLYGMSDNLSYVLAKNNYHVSKYVPYGPVKDAVPYLIRRAQENSSVMGQVSRELELIKKEIKRRKI